MKFEIGYLRIMAEFSANAQMLNEAEALQGKTKEAMIRIQRQQAETESLAEATLEEFVIRASRCLVFIRIWRV